MELRGQDKNIGMPSSKGCNPLQHNQDSSSMLSSAPIISTLADRKENETVCGSAILSPTQTLDHGHLHQHQHHLLNQPPPPPLPPQSKGRDSNPDPDPAQVASATVASPSNCKTPQPQPPQQPPPPPPLLAAASSTTSLNPIRYRECLKNHAATMGGHIVDGCGEFMPSGEEGAPGALRCAACDCHRNFHRREIDGESPSRTTCYYTHNPSRNNSHRQGITIHPIQPPSHPALPPNQHPHHGLISTPSTGPMMMVFGGGGGAPAESSSEDLNMYHSNAGAPPVVQPSFSISKKRFRTKFTQEQKGRMHEFAEKLGWKMQKQDEQEVQHFCNEVGVKRQVFKVWMHNNKQAIKKKQL